MEGSIKNLSQYRFSCAEENIEAAKILMGGRSVQGVNKPFLLCGVSWIALCQQRGF